MASCYQQEEEPQTEIKQHHFDRLPDDIVLVIINKLIHMKILIRFSLVSKRYASLVSQTDSLFVNLDIHESSFLGRVGGFLRNLVAKFTKASSPIIPDYQKLSAVSHAFQQIKYLHLHLCVDPSAVEPLERGAFFRSEAVFGSHFEVGHLLMAVSVNQSKPSVDGGNDSLRNEHFEKFANMLIRLLKSASWQVCTIRELLVRCKMLETAVFSDNYLGGKLTMGKKQIARLQGNQEGLADQAELCVFVTHVPTLDLPKSGYTMNNVVYVSAFPVYKDVEIVKKMEIKAADQGTLDVAFLDDSDLKKWQVFDEAIEQIGNEDLEPMYVTRFPYSTILQ